MERVDAEEWIDSPDITDEAAGATIRDQAVVNRWLGGTQATLAHALPHLRACASDPVRVLDAACGGAELSRRIVDEARLLGKRIEVTALDMSEKAIGWARRMSAGYPEIEFINADALNPPVPRRSFDIVVLATFLHHLSPEQVVTVLQAASDVGRGYVIAADLARSPHAYLGIRIFARLARFHPVSAHDGAVSVCRAYSPSELAELARLSGLREWKLYRHRFCRMALVYRAADCDGERSLDDE